MTFEQRVEAVAMTLAAWRGARSPSREDRQEAEKFVKIYDTLQQIDIRSARI